MLYILYIKCISHVMTLPPNNNKIIIIKAHSLLFYDLCFCRQNQGPVPLKLWIMSCHLNSWLKYPKCWIRSKVNLRQGVKLKQWQTVKRNRCCKFSIFLNSCKGRKTKKKRSNIKSLYMYNNFYTEQHDECTCGYEFTYFMYLYFWVPFTM